VWPLPVAQRAIVVAGCDGLVDQSVESRIVQVGQVEATGRVIERTPIQIVIVPDSRRVPPISEAPVQVARLPAALRPVAHRANEVGPGRPAPGGRVGGGAGRGGRPPPAARGRGRGRAPPAPPPLPPGGRAPPRGGGGPGAGHTEWMFDGHPTFEQVADAVGELLDAALGRQLVGAPSP
jgi:hypothetical protein